MFRDPNSPNVRTRLPHSVDVLAAVACSSLFLHITRICTRSNSFPSSISLIALGHYWRGLINFGDAYQSLVNFDSNNGPTLRIQKKGRTK